MYDPEPESGWYHEYIELYHKQGKEEINLSGWTLCGKKLNGGLINHSDKKLYGNNSTVMDPASFALVTDGDTGTWVYSNYSVNKESLALHVHQAGSLCGGSLSGDENLVLKNSSGDLVANFSLKEFDVEAGDSLQLTEAGWVGGNITPGYANNDSKQSEERVDEDKKENGNLTVSVKANDRFTGNKNEIVVVLDNRGGSFLQNVSLEVNLSANDFQASGDSWNYSRQVSCPTNSSLRLFFSPAVNEIGSYRVAASAELGNKSWTEDDEFAVLNLTNYSRKIELNEVLAAPDGNRTEYIELYNPTARAIPLAGLIRDNCNQDSLELVVDAKKYGLILLDDENNLSCANYSIGEEEGESCQQLTGEVKLNNGGDNLSLWSQGDKIDELNYTGYSEGEKGLAWSQDRADNNWVLTEPSPGQDNLITTNTTNSSGQSGVINQTLAQELVINELLPDPGNSGGGGSEEFVEVYNPTSYDLRVEGFYLKDEASKRDELQGAIPARDHYVVNFSQVLNDDGDVVQLYFNDSVVDEVSYQEAKEGQSKGRSPDGSEEWKWMSATPGKQNPWIKEREVEVEEENNQQGTTSLASAQGQQEILKLVNCPELIGGGSFLKVRGVFYSNKKREGSSYSYAYDGYDLATEGGWTGNEKEVEMEKGWNLIKRENEIKSNISGNYTLKLKFKQNETEFVDSCPLTVKEDVAGTSGLGQDREQGDDGHKESEEWEETAKGKSKLTILEYPREVEAGSNLSLKALLEAKEEISGEYYSYVYDAGDLASEGSWKANPVQEEFARGYNLIESRGKLKEGKSGNYSLKLKLVNESENLSLADKVEIRVLGNKEEEERQSESEGGIKEKETSGQQTSHIVNEPNDFLQQVIAFLTGLWG